MKIRTACWITLFALPLFYVVMLCGLIFRHWPLFIYDTAYNPPLQILTLYRVLWPALFGVLVTAGISSFAWNFLKHLNNRTRLTSRDFCICFFSILAGLIIPTLHIPLSIFAIKGPVTLKHAYSLLLIGGDMILILWCLLLCGFCSAVIRQAPSTKYYAVASLEVLWISLISTICFSIYGHKNAFMIYLRDLFGDGLFVIGLSGYIISLSIFIISCSRYTRMKSQDICNTQSSQIKIEKELCMPRAVFYSMITICIAIPAWFLYLCFLWSSHGGEMNTISIALYGGIVSVIAVPFAFIVSFLMASFLNKYNKKSQLRYYLIIAGFHGIILLCLCLFYAFSSSITSRWAWIDVFIIPFYFMLFLTPPSLVGCTACYLFSNKKPAQS